MNATLATQPVIAADTYGALPPFRSGRQELATTQAYRLGALDAQLDALCVPEMYFRNPTDKRDYCNGYESIKGATLTTMQILGAL